MIDPPPGKYFPDFYFINVPACHPASGMFGVDDFFSSAVKLIIPVTLIAWWIGCCAGAFIGLVPFSRTNFIAIKDEEAN